MTPKSIFSSLTFYVAVLQALGAALVIFATAYPSAGYLLLAKSMIDVLIRFNTKVPVTLG